MGGSTQRGIGKQYEDGSTPATRKGVPTMWNDDGTLRVPSAAKPMPVSGDANLQVGDADVSESNPVPTNTPGNDDSGNRADATLAAYAGSKWIDEDLILAGTYYGSTVASLGTPTDTYIGTRFDTEDFAGFGISAFSNRLGQGYAIWEDAAFNILQIETTAFIGAGAFYDIPQGAKYGRIAFQNRDATGTASFKSNLVWKRVSPGLFMFPAAGSIDGTFPAGLVKNIQTGQQPDGDFVNERADGLAKDIDDVSVTTSTPLGSAGQYESGWVDTDGWAGAELFIVADQVSGSRGIEIEFTDDANATTPTVRATRTYTFTAADVTAGFLVARFPTEIDGMRVRYTNGGTAQGSFFLALTLRTQQVAPQGSLETDINATNIALMARALVMAKNASGTYGNIERGTSGGLDVGIVQHEVDTPIKALSTLSVIRTSVGSSAVEITSSSPLVGRKSLSIKAICAGSAIVYIGHSSAVTSSNGFPLSNDQSIDMEVDDGVLIWAIASTGTQAVSVVQVS